MAGEYENDSYKCAIASIWMILSSHACFRTDNQVLLLHPLTRKSNIITDRNDGYNCEDWHCILLMLFLSYYSLMGTISLYPSVCCAWEASSGNVSSSGNEIWRGPWVRTREETMPVKLRGTEAQRKISSLHLHLTFPGIPFVAKFHPMLMKMSKVLS